MTANELPLIDGGHGKAGFFHNQKRDHANPQGAGERGNDDEGRQHPEAHYGTRAAGQKFDRVTGHVRFLDFPLDSNTTAAERSGIRRGSESNSLKIAVNVLTVVSKGGRRDGTGRSESGA